MVSVKQDWDGSLSLLKLEIKFKLIFMRSDKRNVFKAYRLVLLFLTVTLVVVFFTTMGYPWYIAEKNFLDSRYSYRIDEIRFEEGHRGVPSIRIDSVWHLLKASELKVVPYIKVGDSLVKHSGTKEIIVFRRDNANKLVVRTFD